MSELNWFNEEWQNSMTAGSKNLQQRLSLGFIWNNFCRFWVQRVRSSCWLKIFCRNVLWLHSDYTSCTIYILSHPLSVLSTWNRFHVSNRAHSFTLTLSHIEKIPHAFLFPSDCSYQQRSRKHDLCTGSPSLPRITYNIHPDIHGNTTTQRTAHPDMLSCYTNRHPPPPPKTLLLCWSWPVECLPEYAIVPQTIEMSK